MKSRMDELNYRALVNNVKVNGNARQTRNAVTTSLFAESLKLTGLSAGYLPLISGRKMFPKGAIGELAAILKGPKTLADFEDMGCNYWRLWAKDDGSINVDYGNAWIDFNGTNQLANVVESLKTDPNGRRHIINAWRPDNLDNLDLPCCHYCYQWYVNGDQLEMVWIQRSVDVMIGLPSDMLVAAVLNILMAQTVGLKPGNITMQLGDCHIYNNHLDGAADYLVSDYNNAPTYKIDPSATVFNFTPDMLEIIDYQPGERQNFKLFS